jgi:hypothetical protein
MKKSKDAIDNFYSFLSTGNVTDIRSLAKTIKDTNIEQVGKEKDSCATCVFNVERIKGLESMLDKEFVTPSDCAMSNIMKACATEADNDCPFGCYGDDREWKLEDEAKKLSYPMDKLRSDVFDKHIDQAKFFLSLIKFGAAMSATIKECGEYTEKEV